MNRVVFWAANWLEVMPVPVKALTVHLRNTYCYRGQGFRVAG